MATKIIPEDLPDFNEGQEVKAPAAPVQKSGSAGKAYAPSDYTVSRLRRFPLDDIKRTIGLDVEWMIGHPNTYGVLEALAAGDFTPVPVTMYQHGEKIRGTVRIYPTSAQPGWDSEVHPVRYRLAFDENGRPKLDQKGNQVEEVDRDPIKKGDVIYFDGRKLDQEQVDHLRLTGNLGKPIEYFSKAGERCTMIVSVDPWNNHCLCRTSGKAIRARLLPPVTVKDSAGRLVVVSPKGCELNANGDVVARVALTDKMTGAAVKVQPGGTNETTLLVGNPVELKLGEPAGTTTVSLSSSMLNKISPSVTTFGRDRSRVITYLSAKHVSMLAEGQSVWTGGPRDMSFIISGTAGNASITRVTDRQHCSLVQYDAGRSKVMQTVDYDYAINRERSQEEAQAREKAQAQAARKDPDIRVGQHV